jgi:hypothetical protein
VLGSRGIIAATICAVAAGACAAGAAEAQVLHLRVPPARGATELTIKFPSSTVHSTLAGVPLEVQVTHYLRRAVGRSARGTIVVTAGGARRCARVPGRDRGRRLFRRSVTADGGYLVAAPERTFTPGRQRLCAWVRRPGARRPDEPLARDFTFYDAIFGGYLAGELAADGTVSWDHGVFASHALEVTSQAVRGRCELFPPETERRERPPNRFASGGSLGLRWGRPDDGCTQSISWTDRVLEGPLAGRSAGFGWTEGVTFVSPRAVVAGHSGACTPDGAMVAGVGPVPVEEALALLPQVGCRPGRIIPIRRSGTEPPTGGAYGAAIDGADVVIAPTGTVVDVLVDAEGPPPAAPDPEPPPDSPYPGLPPPDSGAGCSATVTAGPLEGVASCWRRRGDVYETTGRARINGIDVTPSRPGIAIRIDTRSQWITSSGPVEVRVGFLHLYRGPLSWRGRTQVFSIQGRSGSRDPGEPFDVRDVQVFGLPVEGSAELRFDGGRTQLKASIKIPDDPGLAALRGLAGWSGDLTAAATNDAGLVLDGASVALPGLQVGFVEISDARLAITRTAAGHHHFDGGATVYPFRFARVGFTGELGFGVGDGYFRVGAGVENLNRPLVYGFFLQRLAFSVQVNPFGLTGAAGVTFGPQLRLQGSLRSVARLDGSVSYLAGAGGNPAALELAGALRLAEADVADGSVRLSGGVIDIAGNARFTLAGFGILGNVNGWVDGLRAFNVEGAVTVAIPGPDAMGEAVLSTRGIGACKRGFGPDVGFGYRWGAGLDGVDLFANSCDLGSWRELRAGAGASVQGRQDGRAFRVKRGTRTVALSAVGEGAPPNVAFVAPDGQRFQPSAAPEGVVSTDRVLLVQDAATRTTAFAMDAPPAGRWRVETLPGSAPVRRFRGTTSVAPVRIRARVTGRGARRTLRYRLARLRNARVTFVAQGRGTRHTIGSTRRARGRLRFRPAPGRAGRRQVIALVERGGRPIGRSRGVASFRVGRGRPARPRGIRIRRSARSGRRITWRGPRSLLYSVTVRTPDGRRLRYLRDGTRRRVTVPHVPRGQRIRVAIQGRSAAGRVSATARARSRR